MANYEPEHPDWSPGQPWWLAQNNAIYYTRNGLSTIADVTLQLYCIVYLVKLRARLSSMQQLTLASVKLRIVILCIIIEVYLAGYLALIWF